MKVGILGGGQLGRMLALAGYPLGLRFRIFDPASDACAGQVVRDHVVAGFDDKASLERFADGLDVITYEWENVPVQAVRYLSRVASVYPPAEALEVAQDRFLEKSLFKKLGIATAPFAAVESREDFDAGLEAVGLPAVLKTRRGGYDGKGQAVLRSDEDADGAWAEMSGKPLILEGFVPFTRELSILAVSSRRRYIPSPAGTLSPPSARAAGVPPRLESPRQRQIPDWLPEQMAAVGRETAARYRELNTWAGYKGLSLREFYPLVENVHRDGILHTSRAPAPRLTDELQAEAEDIISRVMEATNYVGLMAIELFEYEGHLLANEMAPRVHNSGHWTIEGAETSQFENHLRAVCGFSIGATNAKGHSAMVNLIGQVPELEAVLRIPGAHLHVYGKNPRPGRKVGHVTLRSDDASGIETSLSQIARLIENERG